MVSNDVFILFATNFQPSGTCSLGDANTNTQKSKFYSLSLLHSQTFSLICPFFPLPFLSLMVTCTHMHTQTHLLSLSDDRESWSQYIHGHNFPRKWVSTALYMYSTLQVGWHGTKIWMEVYYYTCGVYVNTSCILYSGNVGQLCGITVQTLVLCKDHYAQFKSHD